MKTRGDNAKKKKRNYTVIFNRNYSLNLIGYIISGTGFLTDSYMINVLGFCFILDRL
jgi:hypothetical protein